jgi:hypothetical protein
VGRTLRLPNRHREHHHPASTRLQSVRRGLFRQLLHAAGQKRSVQEPREGSTRPDDGPSRETREAPSRPPDRIERDGQEQNQTGNVRVEDSDPAGGAHAREVLPDSHPAEIGMQRGPVLGQQSFESRRLGRTGGVVVFGAFQSGHSDTFGSHRYQFPVGSAPAGGPVEVHGDGAVRTVGGARARPSGERVHAEGEHPGTLAVLGSVCVQSEVQAGGDSQEVREKSVSGSDWRGVVLMVGSRESTTMLGSIRSTTGATVWTPWKKHARPFSPDKMVIPLPVPHPAHIAVTIFNRDSDDPIPLESDTCQSILRGIEESHISLDEAGVYRHLLKIAMIRKCTKIDCLLVLLSNVDQSYHPYKPKSTRT